jgi:hypothetical protein
MLTLLRRDDGNLLITTIFVSLIIGALAALTLSTGRQADWSSASDRNSELSLGSADAGVQEVISMINAQAAGSTSGPCQAFSLAMDSTWHACGTSTSPNYNIQLARTPTGFVIDAQGSTGISTFLRKRHIQVTLGPPKLFPDGNYALFSLSSVDVKNNDNIVGDIWANDSVTLDKDGVDGSITSAQSWISETNSVALMCSKDGVSRGVCGNVHSGGYYASGGYADTLDGAIGGAVTASDTTPNCADLSNNPQPKYNVNLGSATVAGNVTTMGTVSGGTVQGSIIHQCTQAPATRVTPGPDGTCATATAPCFTFSDKLYPNAQHFSSVSDFTNNYLNSNKTHMQGVFVVDQSSPSQNTVIDLSGAQLAADTIIVTNAPINTDGVTEANLTRKRFILVSHYAPPTNSSCDSNGGDCAIQAKNHFDLNPDGSCSTVVLLYADQGPVAIKNDSNSNGPNLCGSVISSGIHVKNNQSLVYDSWLQQVLGFGQQTFVVTNWDELPVR